MHERFLESVHFADDGGNYGPWEVLHRYNQPCFAGGSSCVPFSREKTELREKWGALRVSSRRSVLLSRWSLDVPARFYPLRLNLKLRSPVPWHDFTLQEKDRSSVLGSSRRVMCGAAGNGREIRRLTW